MSDNENFSAARRKQGIRYTADEEHRRTSSSTQNNESTYEPLEDLQIGNGSTCEMDTSPVRFHMSTCTNAEPLTLQSDEDISKTTTGVNVDSQMTNKFEPPAGKPKRNIRIAEDLNTTSDKKSMTYVGISTQEPLVRTFCDNDFSVTERRADDQGHTPATTKENITDYELPPASNTLNQKNFHSDMSASAGTFSWEPTLEILNATVSSPVGKSYCSTATELSSWEQNVEQPDEMDVNNGVSRDDVQSAITKVFTVLVDYMDPKPILYKMNEERIFTRRSTLRDIMEKPTTSEKNRNLLDFIIRRDVSVYLHFKRFLRDTKQEPIVQLLEIAERGGDTRGAIDMIKQCATDLNDQDNILLRELAANITMSDVKKKMAICYVYVYIGKEVCRALLEKQVNDQRPSGHDSLTWTIDTFLEMNRENIQPILTRENIHSLFPKAKPDLWNLSLFCNLLINTTCEISRPLRMCLKWLLEQEREIELCNDQNYERKFEQMKEYLMTIADETHDEDFIRKAKELFEPFKDGVISNANCEVISRKIARLTEEFRYSMKVTENELQEIKKGNIRLEKKIDQVLVILGHSQSNDALPKSIPDIPVKIRLNEISPETEQVASEKIVKTLNHTEAQSKLSEAIEDLNKKFKENGYSITNNFKVGCVQMYMRCTSALSFFTLLKDYVSGRLDAALEPLEKAARMLDGCKRVKLETFIFEDDILNILSSFNVCPIEINSTDVSEVGSDTSEANTAESIDTGGLTEDLMNETTTERQLVPDRWSDPQTEIRFYLTDSRLKKENSISVNDPLKDDNLDLSPVSFVCRTIDIKDKDITSSTKKSDIEEFARIPAKGATGGKIDLDQGTDETFDLLCSVCQRKKNTEAAQFCYDCHKILHNSQLRHLPIINIPSRTLPIGVVGVPTIDYNYKGITSSTKKIDSEEFGHDVSALIKHEILNKRQSKPKTFVHFPAVLTGSCRVHDNKPVDMFCRQHNSVECAICMEIYHCDSKEKFYLPEHTMNNPTAANPNKIKKQLDDIASNVADPLKELLKKK